GPTTPVIPSSKTKVIRSMKDLNPQMSSRRMRMGPTPGRAPPIYQLGLQSDSPFRRSVPRCPQQGSEGLLQGCTGRGAGGTGFQASAPTCKGGQGLPEPRARGAGWLRGLKPTAAKRKSASRTVQGEDRSP